MGSKMAKDCLIVRNCRWYSDFLHCEVVKDMSYLKLMDMKSVSLQFQCESSHYQGLEIVFIWV